MFDLHKVRTARPNLYDYLKILALLTMIIDHVGYFLFPEHLRLRSIGRIAFPLFLLLVGYNGSYRFRGSLWITALVVQLVLWVGYIQGFTTDPSINILLVIAGTRLLLDRLHNLPTRGTLLVYVAALMFTYPLLSVMDYGTLAVAFALCGLWFAQKQVQRWHYVLYFVLILFHLYVMMDTRLLDLDTTWVIGISATLLTAGLFLAQRNYSVASTPTINASILFFSRHALALYVIHVLILAGLSYLR